MCFEFLVVFGLDFDVMFDFSCLCLVVFVCFVGFGVWIFGLDFAVWAVADLVVLVCAVVVCALWVWSLILS